MKPWLSKGRKASEELPLRRDDTARFVPWIIAVMVFLATLSLAFALSMRAAIDAWDVTLSATLTVQVPPPSRADAKADTLDQRVEKITAILTGIQGISRVTPVDPEEAKSLLETWLGQGNVIAELPVPRLLDVELAPDIEVDLTDLTEKIESAVPGATLDDHKLWIDDLLHLGRRLVQASFAVLSLICFAAFVIMVFATRSSLVAHNRSIELLHIMGAKDNYIARQFAHHAFRLGLIGSLCGFIVAGLVAYTLVNATESLGEGILPDIHLRIYDWLFLFSIPFVGALLTMGCAWATVVSRLGRYL